MVQINRGNSFEPPPPVRRIPIIAGNWKMNKTVEEALSLIDEMMDDLDAYEEVETVICPPFMALSPVMDLIEDTNLKLGAQNMFYKESGAYTGEISPLMLREVCDYVILGHSERRQYFHETDEDVNLKVRAALKNDLVPIIAVGENLEQREAGRTAELIANQVEIALREVNSFDAATVVIAYEPIWAIGTGKAASGQIANEVCQGIRQTVARLYNQEVASQVRIQYGGSVTGDNIAEFMSQPDIDGALVGGASLKAADFVKIVAQTQEAVGKKG
ncbi:MAG: Triosephosphate isomerase [Chloroflexi bacterium]|jgi:triosephosphate isomerase|nr:Triosephosphate isomerase [Chloroflexota bacterium]